MAQKRVVVYSTPTCPYCIAAKQFLKQNKIQYAEFDVSTDAKAREKMVDKTKQTGVPVIIIGTKIIIGFEREAIKKALGLK